MGMNSDKMHGKRDEMKGKMTGSKKTELNGKLRQHIAALNDNISDSKGPLRPTM